MTTEEKTLGKAGRRFWREIQRTWQLEVDDEVLLLLACRNLDVYEEAWKLIGTEGLFSLNRYRQKIPHPALAVARKAESQFAALLAQLDLRTPNEKPRIGRPGIFEAQQRLNRESEQWQ